MCENSMDLNGIDYLGIHHVLRRGTGEVIEQHDAALLVYDSISGAYMLGCEDAALGVRVIERNIGHNCMLLVVSDYSLG